MQANKPPRVIDMSISMKSFPAFILAAMLALLVGCASTTNDMKLK